MAVSISDELLARLRERLDIVEVISEGVVLRRRGREYIGLCPFHGEKTPSFTVNPEKQLYYCFGCQSGGNVISYVMQRDGLSFQQAVELLAEKANLNLYPENEAANQQRREREKLRVLLQTAASFFEAVRRHAKLGEEARKYLDRRGIQTATADSFQIGFGPSRWDALLNHLKKKGFSPGEAIRAGVVVSRRDGKGVYDRFRNRLVFPIRDLTGQVVGFGGRSLDNTQPKYINSPETILFQKGKVLYGLYQGRDAIRHLGSAVLVEGYMDVVAAHQADLGQAIAALGTGFSREQAALLGRYTNTVILAYDPDRAGEDAGARTHRVLKANGFQVRLAAIPQGLDPDEYIKSYGGQALDKLLKESQDIIVYRLNRARDKLDPHLPGSKKLVLAELLPYLADLENPVEQDGYIRFLAENLSLSMVAIEKEVHAFRQGLQKYPTWEDKTVKSRNNSGGGESTSAPPLAEKYVLRSLIGNPGVTAVIGEVLQWDTSYFFDNVCREVVDIVFDAWKAGQRDELWSVVLAIADPAVQNLVAQLTMVEDGLEMDHRVLADSLRAIQLRKIRSMVDEVQLKLGATSDDEETEGLLKEKMRLLGFIHSLKA